MGTAAKAPYSELACFSRRFGECLPVEHQSDQPAYEREGKE
jgi:hypothetical protein